MSAPMKDSASSVFFVDCMSSSGSALAVTAILPFPPPPPPLSSAAGEADAGRKAVRGRTDDGDDAVHGGAAGKTPPRRQVANAAPGRENPLP